jgi:hypothetical protein
MARYIHDKHYSTLKINRNDISVGLDSAVMRSSPPRHTSSMPVGLYSAVRSASSPRHTSNALVGLSDGAKPSNPHPSRRFEPIGLAAAVRHHDISQRPCGPNVCRAWEKCWFCTEYLEPPKHQRRELEGIVRREAAGKKEEKNLSGKTQGKKERPKKSWIERKMRECHFAARNMRRVCEG